MKEYPMLAGLVREVTFERTLEDSLVEELKSIVLTYDDGRVVRIASYGEWGEGSALEVAEVGQP